MKNRLLMAILCVVLSILTVPEIAQADTEDPLVTREQMATLFVNVFNIPSAPAGTDYFQDDAVSGSESAINALAYANITKGCAEFSFCPASYVTRGEVAILLERVIGVSPAYVPDYFWDDDASAAEASINILADYGIIAGCRTGFYCTRDFITDAELSIVISRVLAFRANPVPAPIISPKPPVANNRDLGKFIAEVEWGWLGTQWNCLNSLWERESSWDNNAKNPISTAYGIPQFLDSTWSATGYVKTSEPASQIRAGLIYIFNRYGTPCSAWAHSEAYNWY